MEIQELERQFWTAFPGAKEPDLCRSPGRVNLIGEHTDYNGLPVLPMAIRQEILAAFRPREDRCVQMRNCDPSFPDKTFENGPDLPPSPPGEWDNYCKAAIQGINAHFKVKSFRGMDMLLTSTLPIAAGLSSSSSLVVACALAYLQTLGLRLDVDISRLELAELMAEAEHYVGTRGGGMDQAVILNSVLNHACKIDFFPLRVEVAPLPEDCAIVVCDSLVKVRKSGAELAKYNAGPRTCALACALVEQQLKKDFGDDVEIDRLGDLWYGPLCLTSKEVEELFERAVPKPHLSITEAAARLKCTPQQVRDRWLGDLPEPNSGFHVQARLRHQLTEYRRVETARDALLAGDSELFGQLMNASHESCANDFQISSPELDTLVAAAREAGALGARLTGAGFGGATVNLVPKNICHDFIDQITEVYYRQYKHYGGEAPVFVAHANDGANYL